MNSRSMKMQFGTYLNSRSKKELGILAKTGVRETTYKITQSLNSAISSILGKTPTFSTSAKAMENFSFSDDEKLKYLVNIVTHRVETKFNMPNLTSVDRLINLYKSDKRYFIILLISYEVTKNTNFIKEVHFKPIEFFSWDCLRLGALGTGQIQIKKAKEVVIEQNLSRKEWILEFCDKMNDFYINEAKKTVTRLDRANKLKKEWKPKKDVWK